MQKAKINEIFTSIQGEGPYVGYRQTFVRFCGCNLNCKYCDTDYQDGKEYTTDELAEIVNKVKGIHSVSLTGGEPLLHKDFLKELLPKLNKIVYLETNATLGENLKEIVSGVDIIAADIKLKSASGKDNFEEADKFFAAAKNEEVNTFYHPEIFVKIVFNNKITEQEIEESTKLCKKYSLPLILQPQTEEITKIDIEDIFNKFSLKYADIRLIPQTHRFLNLK